MPQKNITVQNDNFEIILPRKCNGALHMSTPSSTAALAEFSAQYAIDPAGGGTAEWLTVKLFDPVTKLDTSNLVGPSKSGWADLPVANRIRAIRTDANGGAGYVNLDWREG